jgi:hypothetical protein
MYRGGAWNEGAEAPATPPPHPWGSRGWAPGHLAAGGRVAALRALVPVALLGWVSVWSGPAPVASEVPGCG